MTSVTIQLSGIDHSETERYVSENLRRQNPLYWPIRAVGVVISLLFALGFIGLFTFESRFDPTASRAVRTSAALLLSACGLGALAVVASKRAISATLYKAGSKLTEPFELAVDTDGLRIVSLHGKSELPWASVEKIEQHGRHIFLFTSPNFAVVVPQGAFSTRDQFTRFAEELRALKNGNGL